VEDRPPTPPTLNGAPAAPSDSMRGFLNEDAAVSTSSSLRYGTPGGVPGGVYAGGGGVAGAAIPLLLRTPMAPLGAAGKLGRLGNGRALGRVTKLLEAAVAAEGRLLPLGLSSAPDFEGPGGNCVARIWLEATNISELGMFKK
jgi:hypothetical protein